MMFTVFNSPLFVSQRARFQYAVRGRHIVRSLALMLCCLLFSACETLPSQDTIPDTTLTREEHRQRLQELNHWLIRGRLTIQSDDQQQSAHLFWQQQGEHYRIQLTGPIGFGRLILDGDSRALDVTTADGTRHFNSLEGALHHYRLPPLPLTSLSYWLRGLPAPLSATGNIQYDGVRLLALQQAQWQLDFSHYHKSGELLLPGLIQARHPKHEVKVQILDWELTDG